MNKNDKKISDLEEFFDTDPTDRLPALSASDFPAEDAAAATAIDDGIPTLLKSQALASLPHAHEPADGEDDVADGLAEHKFLIGTLQEELASAEAENQALRKEAAQASLDLARQINERTLADETLAALRDTHGRTLAELDSTRAELTELSASVTRENDETASALTENQTLRTRIQDLETYLTGREAEWHGAEENLAQHDTELESLRKTLSARDTQVAGLQAENDRLETELEQHVRDVKSLNSTIAAGHDAVRSVTQQLYTTQEQLDTLANKRLRVAQLRQELVAEQARSHEADITIEDLGQQLAAADLRADEIAADLRERTTAAEERLHVLECTRKDELKELERARADLLNLATQRDRLVVEVRERNTQVSVLQEERAHTTDALKEQRQIIQNMKDDLRKKLDAIAVIAQNSNTPTPTPTLHSADLTVTRNFEGEPAPHRQEPTRMFVALDGEHALKLPIHKDTMTIGRSADNDIRIRRQFISRHHARIETDAEGAVIHDLGSKNGVVVNSVRVGRQRLRDGDLVDLGEMKFRFVDLLRVETASHGSDDNG